MEREFKYSGHMSKGAGEMGSPEWWAAVHNIKTQVNNILLDLRTSRDYRKDRISRIRREQEILKRVDDIVAETQVYIEEFQRKTAKQLEQEATEAAKTVKERDRSNRKDERGAEPGENHHMATMTEAEAKEILELWRKGCSKPALKAKFPHLKPANIYNIINDKTWLHLERGERIEAPIVLTAKERYVSRQLNIPLRKIEYFRERLKPMPNGCVYWTGPKSGKNGYGRMNWWGRDEDGNFHNSGTQAHRLNYMLNTGRILKPNDFVLHKRMPGGHPKYCVGMNCLRIGDAKENAIDNVMDKRATMRESDKRKIRSIFKEAHAGKLLQREIGKKYGVSRGFVHGIKARRNYKWVTADLTGGPR